MQQQSLSMDNEWPQCHAFPMSWPFYFFCSNQQLRKHAAGLKGLGRYTHARNKALLHGYSKSLWSDFHYRLIRIQFSTSGLQLMADSTNLEMGYALDFVSAS